MREKILVVDDAAFIRLQLKEAFAQCGAVVVGEAADGAECLNQYAIHKPDLVTMDITMPGEDGISVLRQLKKKHPEAKVVMCSAMSQPEKFIEAIQAGAFDFIVKPFTITKLSNVLKKLSTVNK